MRRRVLRLLALVVCIAALAGAARAEEWQDPLAVEQQIYTYLTQEVGLNSAAACGILANIEYESAFQPTALGDQGTSYGLCQWHNARFYALRSYCQEREADYRTVEGQMQFLRHELQNSYGALLKTLQRVENTPEGAYQAAYQWCVEYERPANRYQKAAVRGNSAKYKYWSRYNGVSMIVVHQPVYLEPEELIGQITGTSAHVTLPPRVRQMGLAQQPRRYVAQRPQKMEYRNWHGPAPVPGQSPALGLAWGMLFAPLGDGRKYGWQLPEPEEWMEPEQPPEPIPAPRKPEEPEWLKILFQELEEV